LDKTLHPIKTWLELFIDVDMELIWYVMRNWVTIVPAMVGDFIRTILELDDKVTLETRYSIITYDSEHCYCSSPDDLDGLCQDCGLRVR
jgi:hypothetical protein